MSLLRICGGLVLHPDMTVRPGDILIDQSSGTILAVGEVDEGDEKLDASNGLIMPGLVNAHTHLAMTLLRGYADDKPLKSWLREDIWPVEAHLTDEDVRIGTELGLLEMIKTGTTGFADMYFFMDQVAEAVDNSGLRALLGRGIVTIGKDEAAAIEDFEMGLEFAREYDGDAGGRIRTAVMPHSLTTVSRYYYETFVSRIRDLGRPIHFHANETIDEVDPIIAEEASRPLVYANELGLLSDADFIAHGVHVSGEEIRLLAETGTGVAHCPASNMKLASGIAPIQRMLDAGVRVGIGTDGPASNNDLDMFDELRDAAMVGKLTHEDASAVDAPTTIELGTAGGASLLGFNSGRIKAGANADCIVIDLDSPHLTPVHDLVSHLAYAVRGSDVRHSVCDGQPLMIDREVQTMDEGAIIKTAEQQAHDLIARASDSPT